MTMAERQLIPLPSNAAALADTNAGPTPGAEPPASCANIELHCRKAQVRTLIHQIRDIIADLSFQYSHVVRGQHRQSTRSQAQKRIKALHHTLTMRARTYAHSRSRLIALNCDQPFLRAFRELTKEHLKASTAVLNPNIPGSSSVQLPWIWQTGRWYLVGSVTQSATGTGLMAGPGDGAGSRGESEAMADPAALLECMFFF